METEWMEKMRKFCAYQERSALEVRQKLRTTAVPASQIEQIIEQLQDENFLDEERFTESFIRGKFRTKHWGKIKIKQHLLLKGIDNQIIEQHLRQDINETEYGHVLQEEMNKYLKTNDLQSAEEKVKLYRHFLSKGYEYDLISQCLNKK